MSKPHSLHRFCDSGTSLISRALRFIVTTMLSLAVCGTAKAQYESFSDVSNEAAQSSEQYPEYHGAYDSRSYAGQTNSDYGIYDDASEDDAGPRYRVKYSDEGRYRQPTSLMVLDDKNVLISTKLSGEIYRVEVNSGKVHTAHLQKDARFGKLLPISERVVAVVENQSSCVLLMAVDADSQRLKQLGRLSAPGEMSDLAWDSRNRFLYASGKWSQRLYQWRFDVQADGIEEAIASEPSLRVVELPMCGGKMLLLPQHKLIMVTDAFGRDFTMMSEDLELLQHDRLYGHNVSALAATPDEQMVYFPHQLINEYAKSVTTDITWGGMLSNNLRWLRTERLLRESGEQIFRKGKFYPLGTPGNGAGDPSAMAVSTTGRIAVTLAGINRVAIGNEDDYYFRQINVGYRPVDVAFSTDASQLFVLNQFSDSLSVVDLYPKNSDEPAQSDGESYRLQYPVRHVALGPLREPTQVELGEHLFFNARLSHDNWMSCHSCHSQGHTNGQLNDNFTDKTFGTPKRVLSLLGQSETRPYAWGGMIESVEDQVAHSVTSTMAGSSVDQKSVEAIAAFIRSLPSPPSLLTARGQELEEQVEHGRIVFETQGCANCHSGDQFTSPETYDVGIYDEQDMRLFNPPSLLGVSQRSTALLHDGRARSIRQVFTEQAHQLENPLEPHELEALVVFLQSL